MHTLLGLRSDELEEVHARHGNRHIFATCKQLAATRPAWLERLRPGLAAELGRLQLLRWMHAAGRDLGDVCQYAALGGHLEVLQWARVNGCPWDEWTCAYAAEGGHLEVLQWARANGCPWNRITIVAAAGGGHLEVLQWARANGCPLRGRLSV